MKVEVHCIALSIKEMKSMHVSYLYHVAGHTQLQQQGYAPPPPGSYPQQSYPAPPAGSYPQQSYPSSGLYLWQKVSFILKTVTYQGRTSSM